eukprot:GILJ01010757.1.p1 GENE.GILJ01010757.1~~GILJ01010757.1.p1  ORF type:complete len:331 (-),score=56.65 GILJ01010757.1:252-1244(-)
MAVYLLYHFPCPDGVFALLAAHLYFKERQPSESIHFVPMKVFEKHDASDIKYGGAEDVVYLLDFTGGPGFMFELAKRVKKVIVLDHHKTAIDAVERARETGEIPENMELHLRLDRSGATAALDYFENLHGGPLLTDEQIWSRVKTLFSFVEDADLWKWQLPDSKLFHGGLGQLGLRYDATENGAIFDQLLELDPNAVIEKGRENNDEKATAISEFLDQSYVVHLGGIEDGRPKFGTVLAVKTTRPELRSQLGHDLAMKSEAAGYRGIGCVVYQESMMAAENRLKVSLRSLPEEDTTVISEHYGGGGHKNASSFNMDKDTFEAWAVIEQKF